MGDIMRLLVSLMVLLLGVNMLYASRPYTGGDTPMHEKVDTVFNEVESKDAIEQEKETQSLNNMSLDIEYKYPITSNLVTNIKYSIAQPGNVNLRIYDILGRIIYELPGFYPEAGTFELHFHQSNLPAGVYFYALEQGRNTIIRKMLLIK